MTYFIQSQSEKYSLAPNNNNFEQLAGFPYIVTITNDDASLFPQTERQSLLLIRRVITETEKIFFKNKLYALLITAQVE